MHKKYLESKRDGIEDHWITEIEKVKRKRRDSNPYKYMDEPEPQSKKSCCRLSRKRIISYKSNFKKKWDIFVLILAIINSFMIPFEQAFKPEYDNTWTKIVLDSMVDIVFIFDIGLSFITSFRDQKFQECFEFDRIASNYMSTTRFIVDVLSVLGSRFL